VFLEARLRGRKRQMNFTARTWLASLALLVAISGLGLWGAFSLSASGEAHAATEGSGIRDQGSIMRTDPRSLIPDPSVRAPILTSTPTCVAGGTPGPWTVVSPLPLAARNFSMDSDGTYAYAAGGSNQTIGALNRF